MYRRYDRKDKGIEEDDEEEERKERERGEDEGGRKKKRKFYRTCWCWHSTMPDKFQREVQKGRGMLKRGVDTALIAPPYHV